MPSWDYKSNDKGQKLLNQMGVIKNNKTQATDEMANGTPQNPL